MTAVRNPGKRGRDFEALVDLSLKRDFYAPKFPPVGARFAGCELIPQKMPFDRFAIHTATGSAFAFDCKTCNDPNRFPVGGASHVPAHQRESLIGVGRSNGVAGLLIEATDPDVALVLWLPWTALINPPPSLPWDDSQFIEVAPIGESIDLDALIRHILSKRTGNG